MTKKTKITLSVFVVMVILGGIYFLYKQTPDAVVKTLVDEKKEADFVIEPNDSASIVDFKTALNKVDKGQSYNAWIEAYPSASCSKYQGDSYSGGYENFWCYQCQENFTKSTATYNFYFDSTKSSCTLQQFQMRWTGNDAGVKKDIEEVVSKNLGSGSLAEYKGTGGDFKDWIDVSEFGSAAWENIFTWRNDQNLAYSYTDSGKFSKDSGSHFIWRWQPLLSKMPNYNESSSRINYESEIKKQVDLLEKACKGAGITNCTYKADAVVDKWDRVSDLADIEKFLEEALSQLKKTSKNDPTYPPLLFWISQIKPHCVPDDQKNTVWLEKLKTLGLTFQYNELGGCYAPNDPWMQELSGLLGTIWGQQGFLYRLKLGWALGTACSGGSDIYEVTIEQGEKFLKDYPSTEISQAVILEIAHAYETWWSLSQSGPEDYYSSHPSGGEGARIKSIEYYKLYSARNTLKSEDQESLYRLTNNIDSGQRAYFCIYD